jgi:predicted transport protein
MALGPKQMGEAILRNLEEKTGKTLEQWLTILEKSKLTDKKPAMDFMKNTHGIGHLQAQMIFERFSGQAAYENTADLIPALFNSADLMKAYKKIETAVLKIGSDIRIQPCKTYVPFYRKNQFALVKVSKDKKIVIGVNLDDDFKHSRFKRSKAGGSERINFQTTLETIADFDKEIIEVITSAYTKN